MNYGFAFMGEVRCPLRLVQFYHPEWNLKSGFALTARYFLLLAQEKLPKEKGTRCPRRLAPIPCVPRQTGRRAQLGAMTGSSIPSWLASNRARSFCPVCLRYSARATGPGAPSRKPVGAAEHRSRFGIERAALFELDLQAAGAANPASSASAQTGEKRREPASAGKPSGPPFFWILFFGGAKKSSSPSGRNPTSNPTREVNPHLS